MNENYFLKGQRVISPDGQGEVIDSTGDQIEVKLDSGLIRTYSAEQLTDDNDAG